MNSPSATSSLLDDLLDRLGSALLDMHNSLMPEHARKAADRDYDEVRAAIKAHATRSETAMPYAYEYVDKEGVETFTFQPPDRLKDAHEYKCTPLYKAPVSATPMSLSEFVHADEAMREAIGAEVVKGAIARQAAVSGKYTIQVGDGKPYEIPKEGYENIFGKQSDDKHERTNCPTCGGDGKLTDKPGTFKLCPTCAGCGLVVPASALSATREKNALEATGVAMMAQTDIVDGHSWVRRSPTGDKALDEIEWCQFCGTHKAEVPDWMDHPRCEALHLVRALYVHGESKS